MKLRLVLKNRNLYLYCGDGSIIEADNEVLWDLLTKFNSPCDFVGGTRYWNKTTSEMENAKGTTLAYVNDDYELVICDKDAFSDLKNTADYISPSEYAELHGKSHSLIKRLCEENRISGAKKIRSCWLIPQNAPYPERKKREVKKKEDSNKENK